MQRKYETKRSIQRGHLDIRYTWPIRNGVRMDRWPSAPGRRPAGQGRVEQVGRGGAGRGGRGEVMVHPGGLPAAVVEQVQLAGQDFGLRCAGLYRQLG